MCPQNVFFVVFSVQIFCQSNFFFLSCHWRPRISYSLTFLAFYFPLFLMTCAENQILIIAERFCHWFPLVSFRLVCIRNAFSPGLSYNSNFFRTFYFSSLVDTNRRGNIYANLSKKFSSVFSTVTRIFNLDCRFCYRENVFHPTTDGER